MACIVPVALRINPDIDIHGHPYIVTGKAAVKFGIDVPTVLNILKNESQFTNLRFIGFHIHLGSQIFDISYYQKSVVLLLEMKIAARHLGVNIEYVDIGGGLGVDYELEIPEQQDGDQIGMRSIEVLRFLASELDSMDCEVIFEPGRSLVANAGILVARVLYKKEASGKRFAILDAGMTDLIRPSLYGAYHRVAPVERVPERGEEVIDLVGPICETGDFLARDRNMQRLQRGDLVAVMTAGAYGYVLSSNYNERKRPAEIVVENNSFRVVTVAR
jgi:diaminopimelate decarboxylase